MSPSSPTIADSDTRSGSTWSASATLLDREPGLVRELGDRRLAAERLEQLRRRAGSTDSVSPRWAGTRIVRLLSAMARVMPWRIHHVA